MFVKQKLSGPRFGEFLRNVFSPSFPFTARFSQLPISDIVGFTYVPPGRLIEIASPMDLMYGSAFPEGYGESIDTTTTLGAEERPYIEFVVQFLKANETNLVLAPAGCFKIFRDTLETPWTHEIPYLFCDVPEYCVNGETFVYLFLGNQNATRDSVDLLLSCAEPFPATVVLTSALPGLSPLDMGQSLSDDEVRMLADRAEYLLVSAFDEEGFVVCELPRRA